jgi:outer membrane protein OmpA-like peptidoglycan-associated protein
MDFNDGRLRSTCSGAFTFAGNAYWKASAMRYLIAMITGVALLGAIALLQIDGLRDLLLDHGDGAPIETASVETSERAAGPPHDGVASAEQERSDKKVSLDVARISQTGPSVFAGRAAPFVHVIVLDGTTVVGTAAANANGEWSMVTEYRFATLDPRIHFQVGDGSEKAAALSDSGDARPVENPSRKLGGPAAQLLSRFERVVATAREEAKQPVEAHVPSEEHKTPSAVPNTRVAELSVKPSQPGAPAPSSVVEPVSIPIPMTFVYNEATLTSDGHRAASLLLEYLNLKKFTDVTLTGHADERGLPNYNMELSRQRLLVIEQLLRQGGYQGRLNLVPKGSTEPYTGVDRSRYPYEELMQLDRRVELRNAP